MPHWVREDVASRLGEIARRLHDQGADRYRVEASVTPIRWCCCKRCLALAACWLGGSTTSSGRSRTTLYKLAEDRNRVRSNSGSSINTDSVPNLGLPCSSKRQRLSGTQSL
jgi:hypothetical protein